MDAPLILLGLAIPIGLLVGWVLGIAGWREARRARAEIAALRGALHAAGIATPDDAAAPPRPISPWIPPAPAPEPMAAAEPATTGSPASPRPNPWGAAASGSAASAAAVPPPRSAAPPRRPGLEEALTLRWGIWLGAAALLLAGVFLVRTAIEQGWLGPAERCGLAALLAVALILAAEWLRRRPLPARPTIPWPDQAPAALCAGGVAMLFGAAYAAAVLYALVPPLIGFALMALAALAALGLALRHGPLVAAIGIAGAYLTPALVESRDPFLPGLFAYLLVVTAAALGVVRQVGAAWLGWVATLAAAGWILMGGGLAAGPWEIWIPALFMPAVAALHLALLPGAALDSEIGRRLAWIPVALLAATGLALQSFDTGSLGPAVGLLLLTPIAVAKGVTERRMDLLPWLAALAGLLMLLAWPIGPWLPAGEAVTIEGVVQAILPTRPWPPEALQPFLGAALLLALLHAAAGLWQERIAPRPLRWAALPAAVPVLCLLVAYARVRGFALDVRWGLAALALAAALVGAAELARREGALPRAGVQAAGAVAAMALGAAMVLSEQWLTLAVALFLPPLAWIEAQSGVRGLRGVAAAVAGVVLVRLLLNWNVLEYEFGAWPVLNGLLPAYGIPAASFALAAWLFRRRGDDACVALLEAGAVAFATALLVLEVRHAVTGGAIADVRSGWNFREAALQIFGLAVLATLLRVVNRRLGDRLVLRWAWKLQQAVVVALGAGLILWNPALDKGAVVAEWPVVNELLLAYALPALLAALAAQAPEAGPPAFRRALAGYAFLGAFAWVTLEVRRHFHPDFMLLRGAPGDAELYAYSGAWLLLAGCLLALGIRQRLPALRLGALALIAVTIGKAFLVDMSGLEGLWRVLSFLGLGLALIALGWVYRRFVVVAPPAASGAPPAPTGGTT